MKNGYEKIDKHFAEGNAERILKERATYFQGSTNQHPNFYRYVVLDVIFDPQIIDTDKVAYWEALGVSNIKYAAYPPRNAIIGQRISDGLSTASETPMILFPFFPSHLALPCKAGEHVWVMFEAPGSIKMDIGYWFCKITEIGYVDDVNHTHPPRAFESTFLPGTKEKFQGNTDAIYEFRNGRAGEDNGQRYTIPETTVLRGVNGAESNAYESLLTDSDASKVTTYEAVPRYRKRPADLVLEGSNNTLISLGTNRIGPASNYVQEGSAKGKIPITPVSDAIENKGAAGAIDIVVGRGQTETTSGNVATSKKISDGTNFKEELEKMPSKLQQFEGDPDWFSDKSRILLSQKTFVDSGLGIFQHNEENFNVSDGPNGDGAIIIKSDKVRIIARQDVEIMVSGGFTNPAGEFIENTDKNLFSTIIIKSNGDIVFKPSDEGFIKLGDDSADRALLCTDLPAKLSGLGEVDPTTPALTNTMGGKFGGTGIKTQGTWAKKILVTGAKL